MQMFDKRMNQAVIAPAMTEAYIRAYGYSDYDVQRLDQDMFADDIMNLVYAKLDSINTETEVNEGSAEQDSEAKPDIAGGSDGGNVPEEPDNGGTGQKPIVWDPSKDAEENDEQKRENERRAAVADRNRRKLYARSGGGYLLSKEDIRYSWKQDNFVEVFYRTFLRMRNESNLVALMNEEGFEITDRGVLYRGNFIIECIAAGDAPDMKDYVDEEDKRVYADDPEDAGRAQVKGSLKITQYGRDFLIGVDRWEYLGGEFDRIFASEYTRMNTDSESNGNYGM